MSSALGIIPISDPNISVKGLQKFRPVAAYNFLGRYRLVDFPISNMSNSGIDSIKLFANGNIRPVIDHLSEGARQYNINSKHGSLDLLPLINEDDKAYITDIDSYYEVMDILEADKNEYVVIAPVNIIYIADYSDLLEKHIESEADISILYQSTDQAKEKYINCDTLVLNRQKGVKKIEPNLGKYKNRNISLETYIMKKSLFLQLIEEARKESSMYWLKDIISDHCENDTLNVRGTVYRGNVYYIYDLKSYYDCNMALLDEANILALNNPEWPIYTRTNDSAPAIYLKDGSASKSLICNSTEIGGKVVRSVIGRNVKIGKGAIVEDCIISTGVTIAPNSVLKYAIVDKHTKISKKKDIEGTQDNPVYIARRENI